DLCKTRAGRDKPSAFVVKKLHPAGGRSPAAQVVGCRTASPDDRLVVREVVDQLTYPVGSRQVGVWSRGERQASGRGHFNDGAVWQDPVVGGDRGPLGAGHLEAMSGPAGGSHQCVDGTLTAVGHRNSSDPGVWRGPVDTLRECFGNGRRIQRAFERIGNEEDVQRRHTNSPINHPKMIDVTPISPVVTVWVR